MNKLLPFKYEAYSNISCFKVFIFRFFQQFPEDKNIFEEYLINLGRALLHFYISKRKMTKMNLLTVVT